MIDCLKDALGLGNFFFKNMTGYLLSKKYRHNCIYNEGFMKLGIDFNKYNVYENEINNLDEAIININDDELHLYFENKLTIDFNKKYKLSEYCQLSFISKLLLDHFSDENFELRKSIINNNIYKDRYNNNNDLIIHLRLLDPLKWTNEWKNDIKNKYENQNPFPVDGLNYYRYLLNSINYENGYITTDVPNCTLVNTLSREFNLKILDCNKIYNNDDEINTIQFASTCKYILLSHGTFSWLIGLLGFYSNIYYLNFENFNKTTYGWSSTEMYYLSNWNKINYKIY
tara:strand:- start:870 stop:1724 length:855 start_codon:yes stop_codon:yes gene_type:complete